MAKTPRTERPAAGPPKTAAIATRELDPSLWPDLEALFGDRGACGGCWCMFWRIRKGERWDDVKGDPARARLRKLVADGAVRGVLAYAGGRPVGWCTFGPRRDFSRLDRSPSLACDDAERVWSIPCFFIKASHRGCGVATALLARAVKLAKKHGAQLVEAYPVRPGKPGEKLPAAFAWTGTRSLFDKAGFTIAGNEGGGKERVRRALK